MRPKPHRKASSNPSLYLFSPAAPHRYAGHFTQTAHPDGVYLYILCVYMSLVCTMGGGDPMHACAWSEPNHAYLQFLNLAQPDTARVHQRRN